MNDVEESLQTQIAQVVQRAQNDPARAHDLFRYTWTMVCVQRGLMRVVREVPVDDTSQLVVEEVCTGRRRVVARPWGLEGDVERLAVEAMARILRRS